MPKKTVAQMAQEMVELKALIAALTNGSPTVTVPAEAPTTATKGFKVTRRVEASEKYGVEYCHIHFIGANGKGIPEAPTKEDKLGFEAKAAIKATRYGQQGKGKFRWDRNARAFSGQTAFVPQIVLNNLVK